MGKSLIIKGADFSVNGIVEVIPQDITSLLAQSGKFYPRHSIGALNGSDLSANSTRCCLKAVSFQNIGIDISEFSIIEVNIKSGFDYVFGTGPAGGTTVDWQGWSGTTGGQSFAWVTGNQQAIATVDNTTLSMTLNLRYDDNTTEFSANTVLTDIIESIILYK